MKALSRFVLLFAFALLVSCSGGSSDLDEKGLKGNVRSTSEFQCDATYENDQWVASAECADNYWVVEYDPEGNYTRAFTMSGCGDTTSLTVPKRENGHMVEEAYFTRINMTPVHHKMVQMSRTVMDPVSDEQVNFEVWQNDQLRYEGATYYDSKGRVERQVQVVNNREVIVHNVYEKGLLVEMWMEEMDGRRSATQLYEYAKFDEQGNWTLRLVYPGEEKITPELAVERIIEYY